MAFEFDEANGNGVIIKVVGVGGGVMAGFQAVTERQERLLQAVLGLDISDSAIGSAAERYRSKLSVINGGY